MSVVAAAVTFGGSAAVAVNDGTQTPARFEIVDASQDQNGNLQVTIQATSDEDVRDFKFWYEDLSGGSEQGPTELGDGNFSHAFYDNGTQFQPGDPVNQSSGNNGQVFFVFDSQNTNYDYVSNAFRINATGYDADYATADTGNRSVMTANHYRLSAEDHNGNSLTGVPLMFYHPDTNVSKGFAFLSAENPTLTYHCQGVDVGGSCTDPDTDASGTLYRQGTLGARSTQAPVAVQTLSLSESNASKKVDPSQGATTLTADRPTAPVFLRMGSQDPSAGSPPTVDSLKIVDAETGNTVWQASNVQRETQAPVFLSPNTEYEVDLTNSSEFGTERRSVVFPTKGITSAQVRLPADGLATSTVTGQVVDESGNAVSGAVVVAEPEFSNGPLNAYNSTTTDSNGVFSMSLPESEAIGREYSFRLLGTDASGGTPIYYPTRDANDGEGYVVQSSKTVLPPMTIKQGGRVDITVTNDTGGQLPVGSGFTSLSQTSTAYPVETRTATSNGYSTFSFGQNIPNSASVALMSPTTGSDSAVTYNVWGTFNAPPKWVCAESVSVAQGQDTDSNCGLEEAGYLNVSLEEYGSVVQQSGSAYATVDRYGFFFENELVVRNDTTGEVVAYLGPRGAQQFFMSIGSDQNDKDVSVPVPPGDYRVELRPSEEWLDRTTVNDTAAVTVTAGQETDVTLDRGRSFEVRPVIGRMGHGGSLTRADDNVLAFEVFDPATGGNLTDSEVTVAAQLRHPNGTTASSRVPLSYNATDGSFEDTTFRPKDLGVDAGTYRLAVTTSHSTGTRTYNSTVSVPVQVSGFSTSVELSSRTVAPGETLLGRIAAYDGGTGVDAPASNVEIAIYDRNGKLVSTSTPSSGVSNGEGSFEVTVPDEAGQYRVATKIESSGGKQGISQRWIRVSQVDLEASTDRRTYGPTDTVALTVTATDATDGSAIENASVTVRVNGQRTTGSTDSDGKTTFSLDPGTYADGPEWRRGHPISVVIAQETDTGVVRKATTTGFEVSSFDVRTVPANRTFGTSDSVKVDVLVPTDVSVESVSVTELDGQRTAIGGNPDTSSAVAEVADGVYRVDLGEQPAGDHFVEVTVETTASGSETGTTGFQVRAYSLSADLDKRSYETGETVPVSVEVRDPDGNAVSGQQVTATLNTTSPVRSVDTASNTTAGDGTLELSLSSGQSGFHFVRVDVGGQQRYLGLQVSEISATLEDGSGQAVAGYNVEPGTTETIHVSATNADGSAVPDDSRVTALVTAYGDTFELGSAKTSGGDASISFTVPESVPAGDYPLAVRVTTPDGATGSTTGTIDVTGTNALGIQADTAGDAYTPGATVEFSATVTRGDGSAVANEDVDFVVQSEGSVERRVATVSTDSAGVATGSYSLPSDADDGEYVVQARLNDSQSIRAFSGFRVRSLDVSVDAEDGPFAPGDTVQLTISANDTTTDEAVAATGGSVVLQLPGSDVEKSLSVSGSAPYTISVTIPDDGGVTGTRTVTVTVKQDRARASASTLIDVRNDTETANLTVDGPVVAGESTTVTVNGSLDATATLTAFSPDAGTVAYNDSVAVSSSGDTTATMTIESPGVYVVKLSVPGVGTITEVIEVEAGGGGPSLATGTDLATETETFSKTEDVYVTTNQSGMTATLVSENGTYTVPLDQQDGDTYYGVLSETRPAGVYLVRLDSANATDVNSTLIEVES